MHKRLDEFEFRELAALERLKIQCYHFFSVAFGQIGPINPIDLELERWCFHIFSAVYDAILLILASNEDMHKSFDEFKFSQELRLNNVISYH